MNYIITGGTGFIGTHLTNLIKERYPNAQVYNLDIVKPGTPNQICKMGTDEAGTASDNIIHFMYLSVINSIL